jgi:hypothetical protein
MLLGAQESIRHAIFLVADLLQTCMITTQENKKKSIIHLLKMPQWEIEALHKGSTYFEHF